MCKAWKSLDIPRSIWTGPRTLDIQQDIIKWDGAWDQELAWKERVEIGETCTKHRAHEQEWVKTEWGTSTWHSSISLLPCVWRENWEKWCMTEWNGSCWNGLAMRK